MSAQRLITQEDDSWVELHFDSCSEHSEDTPALCDITDLEKLLLEAQRESSSSSRTSSHCSSPHRVQTPPLVNTAFNTHSKTEEEVIAGSKQEADAVVRICDWSSRPENVPPVAFVLKRPKRNRVCGSGSTPKNDEDFNTTLLKLLLPSLVFTHIFMLGLGICIGRRLSSQCSAI